MPTNKTVASLNARVGLDTTNYERGAQRLNRANRQARQEQQRLRRETQRLTREFQNNVNQMRNFALRITALGGAFVFGVQRIASMGDELAKMSDRLGVAVGELQALQLAAESVGLPFDKVAGAFSTLQIRIARLGLATSSFRTELTALNPQLLEQLDSVDSLSEGTRVFLRELDRVGREQGRLAQVQLAQAGFGQGGALPALQIRQEQDRAREFLLERGLFLTDEDTQVFREISQLFTDISSEIKNALLVALVEFREEIKGLVGFMRDFLAGAVPFLSIVGGAAALAFTLARAGSALAALLSRLPAFLRTRGAQAIGPGRLQAGFFGGSILAGASYGLDAYFRLQDTFEDRGITQGGAINVDEATRANLRRFQQGGFRGPLDSRQQLFRLANAVYGPAGVNAILANSGLDEDSRPSAGFFNLGPGFRQDPAIARRIEIFNRNQNQRISQALRGTANILFPPEVYAAPGEETPETEVERLARLRQEGIDRALAFQRTRARGDQERFERGGLADIRTRLAPGFGRGISIGEQLARQELVNTENRYRAIIADLRTSREPERTDTFRVQNAERLALLAEQQRRAQEALLEIEEKRETAVEGLRRAMSSVTDAIKASQPAFRALLVDTVLDGENRLRSFGNILLQIARQVIDTLLVNPLVSYLVQGLTSFAGGFGGTSAPNPGLGTPPPNVPPGYPTPTAAAVPTFQPAFSAPGPNVNIVVNGVEDQAAFDRVATRVESTIVPRVTSAISTNINRPGTVRRIRG